MRWSLRDRRTLRVFTTLSDRPTEPLLDPKPDDDLVAQVVLTGDLLGEFQEILIHT
ncbi:MAG: hypothetical protein HY717_21920 [Planctomycetes bacterium]|nr:hypothetical protein [Planctomycetota bacterium]